MSDEHTRKNTFEELYLKKRKKRLVFMSVGAVLAILLIGLFVVNLAGKHGPGSKLSSSSNESSPHSGTGPAKQGVDDLNMKDFFNSDGSVNTDEVNALLQRVPSQFRSHLPGRIEPQIDAAVANSEITSQQAVELKKALGI